MIELLDLNVLKIVTVFSVSPGSRFARKTIKEKTNIPNLILDKYLAKLLNLKFLTKEKNFLVLNFKNNEINDIIKIVSEQYSKFKQLPLKDYFLILSLKDELVKIRYIGDVYLFGSYAKLIFKEDSDVDIAIISEKADKKNIEKPVKKLEKRYKKNIEVHYFSKKFYNNRRDPLVKDILQHGIKMI